MNSECETMIDEYAHWFKKRIRMEEINGVCEITTPFLDRHNDHLQIYVKRVNNRLLLTDDGSIIRDLKLSGFDITTEKRRVLLNSILNGAGVHLIGDEIVVEAGPEDFPQKKHNLIQAMLAINDLFVMAAPVVASVFREDVENYLRQHNIRYTPTVKFTGRSGLDHSFDFVIPLSRTRPERILKAINRPNRQSIGIAIFSWLDIRGVRPVESKAYLILNDLEQSLRPDIISAPEKYGIKAVLWSRKDEHTAELAE